MALPLVLVCFCEVQAGLAKDAGEAVQMLGSMSAVLDALVRGLWILKWCLQVMRSERVVAEDVNLNTFVF